MVEELVKEKGNVMKRILAILVLLSSGICFAFSFNRVPQTRLSQDKFCFDFVKVLPAKLVYQINIQGAG